MSSNRRAFIAPARVPARSVLCAGVAVLATFAILAASPANALTIKATFDSSITSLSNAAQIESAFNTVAKFYDTSLSSPVTVNIDVSWGSIDGQALGKSALSSSLDNLYGYFNYSQIQGYLDASAAKSTNAALKAAVKDLPKSDPGGVDQYAIPSAEAKALGLISATQPGYDGYIGFSSTDAFDFNPADGVTAKQYDFEGAAAHELAEVLGRITGLDGTNPYYRTPLDLYRYGAAGQLGYTYKSPAYFSIDDGVTDLGDFSYSSGDRGDWLPATTGLSDVQTATGKTGVAYKVSVADLTALDVLGWAGKNPGDTQLLSPTTTVQSFIQSAVPEPGGWALMLFGVGAMGAKLRGRRRLAAVLQMA